MEKPTVKLTYDYDHKSGDFQVKRHNANTEREMELLYQYLDMRGVVVEFFERKINEVVKTIEENPDTKLEGIEALVEVKTYIENAILDVKGKPDYTGKTPQITLTQSKDKKFVHVKEDDCDYIIGGFLAYQYLKENEQVLKVIKMFLFEAAHKATKKDSNISDFIEKIEGIHGATGSLLEKLKNNGKHQAENKKTNPQSSEGSKADSGDGKERS